ncbi:MAG TPA: YeeE/YedE thiosulfate transporter family protein [Bacteroidota bacterium]|nr:YeeE/YedE thiosulfate transporter family protein [Bacteroidota bacterium]
MGPFVPDIITNEMNLVVAFLLGIAFGAVLEQAGFSSSRRLAGLFYGYDFTVLRVFFTAAVTAMLGVIFLGYFGYLDTDIIYVNPMFLGPAIVGGAIMGVGFILGGYCPGTSIVAASIGKKDAIAFVSGGILGVFVFGELFPLYDGFYASGALGPIRVFDSLGMSQGVFVLLLILVAVGAFAATTWIEKRVNPESPARAWPRRAHALAGAGLVALGIVALFIPDRKTLLVDESRSAEFQRSHPIAMMTADELAFRIIDRDPRLVIVDVRTALDSTATILPGSVNIPPGALFGKQYAGLLGMRHEERVFVDRDGSAARNAAFLALRLGYDNVRVLEGGVAAVDSTILGFTPSHPPRSRDEADTFRFRTEAKPVLAQMIREYRARASAPPPAVKKISGGC